MESLNSVMNAVLPALLARTPLTPEKVRFAWRVSVGAAIDRATTVRLAGATLVVTGQPQWLREIQRAETLIIGRLQRVLGDNVVRGLGYE